MSETLSLSIFTIEADRKPLLAFAARKHHDAEAFCADERVLTKLFSACACRKLDPGILVMQSAQDWVTKNVAGAIDGARDRCIFLQG